MGVSGVLMLKSIFFPVGLNCGEEAAIGASYTQRGRLGAKLGILLMMAANLVDWSLAPEIISKLFAIRLAGALCLAWGLFLLRRVRSIVFLTTVLYFLVIVASAVNGAEILLTGGYSSYWAMGPGLVILVAGAVAHLPARIAVLFSAIGFAGYLIPCVLAGEPPHNPMVANAHLFFYASFAVLSVSFSSFQYKLALAAAEQTKKTGEISGILRMREAELHTQNTEINLHRALAQDAGKAQSEFLANISHELRTPLTSILGFSSLLESRGQKMGGADAEMLRRIQSQGEALLSLIENLVDLSSISGPGVKLELKPVPVHLVIHQVVDALQLEIAEAGHTTTAECRDKALWIAGDHERLVRAIAHIMSNAIKFTPKGTGKLVIGCQLAEGLVEIFVKDNGVGMDPEQTGVIFKSFRQLDGSSSRKRGGAGVGLPIVKKVVEMHGGFIKVKTAPSQGSEFILSFPALVKTAAAVSRK